MKVVSAVRIAGRRRGLPSRSGAGQGYGGILEVGRNLSGSATVIGRRDTDGSRVDVAAITPLGLHSVAGQAWPSSFDLPRRSASTSTSPHIPPVTITPSSPPASTSTSTITSAALPPIPVPEPALITGSQAHRLSVLRDILVNHLGAEPVWVERVEAAEKELREGRSRKGRVAVYGTPESAYTELISLLLYDPLLASPETERIISTRHDEERGEVFFTRYNDKARRDVNSLEVDSPWLRDTQSDVVEILSSNPETILTHSLSSDTLLLILDPIRLLDTPTLSSLLPQILGKPNVHLIINGELPGGGDAGRETRVRRVKERLMIQLEQLSAGLLAEGSGAGTTAALPQIHFVSTSAASRAVGALQSALSGTNRSGSTSRAEEAFRVFREGYTESQLGALGSSLLRDLQAVSTRGDYVAETTENLITATSRYIALSLAQVDSHSDEILSRLTQLETELKDAQKSLKKESVTSHEAISEEMQVVRRGVEELLRGRLGWGKVLGWNVDVVADEVGREVEGKWGYDLTQKLSFEAGKLEATRHQLSRSIFDVLAEQAPGSTKPTTAVKAHQTPGYYPFHSPILLNQLRRVDLTSNISPQSLLRPVTARRNQILQYSIPALQSRAHKMAWTTISLSFLSSSLAWSAAVPLAEISPSTGFAAGLLGIAAAMRWGVGYWVKAQKRFWQDWERVVEGLEADLQDDLSRELKKIGVLTKDAVEGVRKIVDKRGDRIAEIEEKLRAVQPSQNTSSLASGPVVIEPERASATA